MPTLDDLLAASTRGDQSASAELYAALYHELHRLARYHLRGTSSAMSLGTTTLLHEAFLALSEREGARFEDRSRFLSYASKTMRRLVIDYLRSRRAVKRGGEFETVGLDGEEPAVSATDPTAIETLDLGLEELGTVDPGLAELVDLHFFCGFSFVEIAAARGVSDRTVQRDWRKARMFLQRLATE